MRSRSAPVTAVDALPGRAQPIVVTRPHLRLRTSMVPPFPDGMSTAFFAMGCFWGAERVFFELPGVYVTAVGYQGGFTPNATYDEVCTGRTGHTETVEVVFDSSVVSYTRLVQTFFENHNPTQGDRQGNDVGTQYRSAIFATDDEQLATARDVANVYQERLSADGFGAITTEIALAGPFYMAEEYHQQYLISHPDGYCGLGGTGVSCPIGVL